MKIDGLYHFYEAKDHLSHEKIIKLLNINRFICQLTVLFRPKKKWNKELFVADNLLKFLTITSINYNYKFTWYILSESTCVVSYQWPVLTPVPIRDIDISCRTCLSLVVKQIKFRFQLCVNIHVFYSSRYIKQKFRKDSFQNRLCHISHGICMKYYFFFSFWLDWCYWGPQDKKRDNSTDCFRRGTIYFSIIIDFDVYIVVDYFYWIIRGKLSGQLFMIHYN